jgi:phospholipid transport system substrate-binding protein
MRVMIGKWFAACIAGVAVLAFAAELPPDEMVRKTVDEVLAVIKADKNLQAGNQKKLLELVDAKVLPNFDFTRMTQLAMGRSWRDASDAQKEALTREFRALLVRTYSSSLSQYRNQTIEVKTSRIGPSDIETTVKTVILQSGGPGVPIDYSMAKGPAGWKVHDVVIDGVSLVTTYRGSFSDQVRQAGIDGLIKTLADRNAALSSAKAEVK